MCPKISIKGKGLQTYKNNVIIHHCSKRYVLFFSGSSIDNILTSIVSFHGLMEIFIKIEKLCLTARFETDNLSSAELLLRHNK